MERFMAQAICPVPPTVGSASRIRNPEDLQAYFRSNTNRRQSKCGGGKKAMGHSILEPASLSGSKKYPHIRSSPLKGERWDLHVDSMAVTYTSIEKAIPNGRQEAGGAVLTELPI